MLRIVGILLVALTSSVLLIAPARAASAVIASASASAWTLDQGEAAVRAGDIASLSGATAVLDEAAVRAAIGRAPIRVALVPFVPVDDNRELMEQRALDLQTWSEQQGWPLIVVQGLQVLVSAYQISPGAVADLEPVLAHNDVTHQVLRAIVVLQKEATGTSGGDYRRRVDHRRRPDPDDHRRRIRRRSRRAAGPVHGRPRRGAKDRRRAGRRSDLQRPGAVCADRRPAMGERRDQDWLCGRRSCRRWPRARPSPT